MSNDKTFCFRELWVHSFGELWVHSHANTGDPKEIDVVTWHGPVYVLDFIRNSDMIDTININVPLETWVECEVSWSIESSDPNILYVTINPKEVQK